MLAHPKPSLRLPLASSRTSNDTPRTSSPHNERTTPTTRPVLLVRRHALGSSGVSRRGSLLHPASACSSALSMHCQREHLWLHGLQRESPQTMALHCNSLSAAGNR